jgi:hypothetical protein
VSLSGSRKPIFVQPLAALYGPEALVVPVEEVQPASTVASSPMPTSAAAVARPRVRGDNFIV